MKKVRTFTVVAPTVLFLAPAREARFQGTVCPDRFLRVDARISGSVNYFATMIDRRSDQKRRIALTTRFVLDRHNRIVAADDAWDRFACENGARDVTFSKIAGSLIWDHVQGDETRAFLNDLFFACRHWQEPLSFDYRCDAPHLERLVRQTITPQADGGLAIDNVVLRERQFPTGSTVILLKPKIQRSRCSRCCSIQVGDTFVDPFHVAEEVVEIGRYGICPVCRREAEDLSLAV